MPLRLSRLSKNDYLILARFVVPLAFTEIAADIGEEFLARSIARSANVVETLAAFGLAYVIVKFFVGALAEIKHAGLVLVHDRRGFWKILVFVLTEGALIMVLLLVIANTQLGTWLIEDLHGVSSSVSAKTHSALAYLSAYPMIDAVSWYHGGVLLKWHHSTLVGAASFADILAQIFSVAILLYTPLVCTNAIAVPVLAAYGGVITRCTITVGGFYWMVFTKLHRRTVSKVTLWKVLSFISPLMLVLSGHRISRPIVNLFVARSSPSCEEAAEAVAVLTASYPLGRLPYGWLNQLRPISPAFQKKVPDSDRPVIAGKKIGIFVFFCFVASATASIILFWVPGVSVAILEYAVGIPHDLAVQCVNPLRGFSFFCVTVSIRASLTGWLTLHHQTKLVAPSAFIRTGAIITALFVLPQLGVEGALMGVLALVVGFYIEMIVVVIFTSIYGCWRHWKTKGTASLEEAQHSELRSIEAKANDSSEGRSVIHRQASNSDSDDNSNSREDTATSVFIDE